MQEIIRVVRGMECDMILTMSRANNGISVFPITSKDEAINNGYQDIIPDDIDFQKETLLVFRTC